MEGRSEARRRALRAARVTTLGLVAAAPGCYASNGRFADEDAGPPPPSVDAGQDAGRDGGHDSGAPDAGYCHITDDWEEYNACCDAAMWSFERGCMAWGPFVPPADGERAARHPDGARR